MNRDKRRKTSSRANTLEVERLKTKISNLEEQNDYLKNRVKQTNTNLDALIDQLKYKERKFDEEKKVYEAEINLLKNQVKEQEERNGDLQRKYDEILMESQNFSNMFGDELNETTESRRIEKDVKNLLQAASNNNMMFSKQQSNEGDKTRIKELEAQNQELLEENSQLKEVAMMIDNMINFAQNNDILLKRKKDLQKKKNMLRIEIQKQMASLGELKNKVGPIDVDFYGGGNSTASPKRYASDRKVFDEDGNVVDG